MSRQEAQVLNYLRTHEFITGVLALRDIHVYRLSEIVRRLRARGYKIITVIVREPLEDGFTQYGKYYLKEEP